MAFADPQSVTISGTPISLPRISTEGDETVYQSADGLVQLLASHDAGKRLRHVIRLNHSKVTADPFIPAENVKVSTSQYLVIDAPTVGYTAAEQLAIWVGFRTALAATSDLLVTKLIAGES